MIRPGEYIGRYKIERRLGHGGMGTLYLAHDPVLDRQVALKLLLGDIDQPGARDRFVREARAAAALGNPNIVTIYDYGDYASQPYIVMEYIHGETLAEVIRAKPPLPVATKLRWMEELCSAVGYAHGRGIIHRDIKPPNLMIDSYGRLKVLDFGIARMRGTLATSATGLIGTPGYCAPEQIKGGEIDHRSDLFSIGVVCYELVSYTEAFGGDTAHVVTYRILSEDPQPLSIVCPGVDPELERIVMQALRKPADARFPAADALRQALADVRVRLEGETDGTVHRYTIPHGTPGRRPGTGRGGDAQRARSTDGGGVLAATPPPDPRRTDREIAARLRVTRIQEHLREARTRLAAGEYVTALAECQGALKLDDAHPEARELISEINAAALAAALEAAEAALARNDRNEALAQAREALQLDPDSVKARVLEDEALQIADGRTQLRPATGPHPPSPGLAPGAEVGPAGLDQTVLRPSKDSGGPGQEVRRPTTGTTRADARGERKVARQWRLQTTRQRAVAATVLLAALAGTVAAIYWRTPPAPGLLVIDAVPWATIEAVENEAGQRQPLAAPATTPFGIQLAPGTYRITVQGPAPEHERRIVTVQVQAGGSASIPTQRFHVVDVDEYFRPYVTVPVEPLSPAVPQPEVKQ